jgi:hypothetical protein
MNNFRYYKISLPDKTYVARAYCISLVARYFYEEFDIDEADDMDQHSNEFLCFEPLDKPCWKVNGVPAKEALDAAFAKYKEDVDRDYEEIVKVHGLETGKAIMDEEYGYSDLEGTPLVLEADYIPETEFEEYITKIHDKSNVLEVFTLE